MIGTAGWMSPEQARGERVDHRSDIFSFGVVLYEIATGARPFQGKSRADVISAILNAPHTAGCRAESPRLSRSLQADRSGARKRTVGPPPVNGGADPDLRGIAAIRRRISPAKRHPSCRAQSAKDRSE